MTGVNVVLDTQAMLYGAAFAHFDAQCREKKRQRQVFCRSDLVHQPKAIGNKKFVGSKRVAFLRDLLANGFSDERGRPLRRSIQQVQLHEAYIRTCLPKLYEEEWEDNQERILKEYEIDRLQQETMVVMPRRSGKTWSVAMFCAVMLLACRDVEVSVFATGQRIASKLLKLLFKMLKRAIRYLGEEEYKIAQSNSTMLLIIGPDGTERICGCYPGNAAVSFLRVIFLYVSLRRGDTGGITGKFYSTVEIHPFVQERDCGDLGANRYRGWDAIWGAAVGPAPSFPLWSFGRPRPSFAQYRPGTPGALRSAVQKSRICRPIRVAPACATVRQ